MRLLSLLLSGSGGDGGARKTDEEEGRNNDESGGGSSPTWSDFVGKGVPDWFAKEWPKYSEDVMTVAVALAASLAFRT